MVTAQPLFSEASACYRNGPSGVKYHPFGIVYRCLRTWYYGWRHASEVSEQLRARTTDTRTHWTTAGYDLDVAEKVCQAIEAACGWPNHRFVPEDPLDVVVDSPFDALAIVEFIGECEERVGVRLEPGAMQHATTVGDAVQIISEVVLSTMGHKTG